MLVNIYFENFYLIVIDEGKTAAPVHALIELFFCRSDYKLYKAELENTNLMKEEKCLSYAETKHLIEAGLFLAIYKLLFADTI